MQNVVAIVGRPNVGKSTLFNRLVGARKSIVHDEPGVTRDRLYHDVKWTDHEFTIIDTGGIEIENRPYQEQIKLQAQIAIEEASVLIFVVDGNEGVTNDDEYIINILRRSGKPIIIAANKLEGNKNFETSIWGLGVENIFPISAAHGEGVGDLLDLVCSHLNFEEHDSLGSIKLAIIGRPNAGKSSLLNTLLNEQRSIVSPIANTTRDSVNAHLKIGEEDFTIIDTAGINRKSRLIESVDHYALSRAMRTIEDSDMVVLVIDAEREISHFDSVVGGYAFEQDKPIILVINKWDLIQKETNTMINKEKDIRKHFKYISWAPMVFVSAKNKLRLNTLLDTILLTRENMKKRIKTAVINNVLADIQMMKPSPSFKGGRLQISFGKQLEADIPTFSLFVNNKDFLHFSYKRYIENQFREYFGFEGVNIKLLFRNKKDGGFDE